MDSVLIVVVEGDVHHQNHPSSVRRTGMVTIDAWQKKVHNERYLGNNKPEKDDEHEICAY